MAASDAAPSLLLCCLCRELLDEPVLLSCLHNCCKGCVSKYAAKRDGSILVRCSLCLQESDATTSMHNLFVAGLVKSEKLSREVPICDFCTEEGRIETVVARCDECAKFMCQECVDGHQKFNKSHSVALTSGEAGHFVEAHAPSAHLCPLHDRRQIEMMCLRCELLTCLECAETCMTAVHEVQHIGSKSTQQFVSDTKTRLVDLHSLLDQPTAIGVQCMELKNALKDAKKEGTSQLLSNKTCIINAVENAHAEAQKALDENFDMLDSKVNELMTANEKLRERSHHAVQYSRALVHSGDVTCLLLQQKMLQSNLRALVDDQGKLHPPSKTSDLLKIQSNLPANVSDVLLAWIGTQAPIPDDLFCSADQALECEARLRSRAQTSDCGQPQHSEKGSEDTVSELPDLSPAFTTFQSISKCCDIAVSSDGCCLLLAALEDGLLEWDVSGKELSYWRPAEKTSWGGDVWVTAVEALQDGRVAVGLSWSGRVVLLSRAHAAAAWVEDNCINTGVRIGEGNLSVHADLVAVAERSDRSLSLLNLRSGRELSIHERQYYIGGVAVTAEAVLTASCGKVKLSDGREGWVVDAYSHDGQRLLWRQEQGQGVTDICTALSGQTLYMTFKESDRVTAVRAKDGSMIKDLLSNSVHGLKSPAKVSMGGRGQQTVVAVLSSDNRTVTVYRAKPGQ